MLTARAIIESTELATFLLFYIYIYVGVVDSRLYAARGMEDLKKAVVQLGEQQPRRPIIDDDQVKVTFCT